MIAYRVLGIASIVALVTNVAKHGLSLGGVLWPLLLAAAMFFLGTRPNRTPRGWRDVGYLLSVVLVLSMFGTVVYQRFLR